MRIQLLLIDKLTELHTTVPNFSFGELIYSVLRDSKIKPDDTHSSWLMQIKDTDFMAAIERTIKFEKRINEIDDAK